MKVNEYKIIKECLPKGRTVYRYRPDAYAAYLLSKALKTPQRVKDLKNSNYASLLRKPIIKNQLKNCRDGKVSAEDFNLLPDKEDFFFLLSIGCWGEGLNQAYSQTSRSGVNLVLRLDFSNQHDAQYKKFFKLDDRDNFEFSQHPISDNRFTLAWARLDIDLDKGEVLIEEIQNDWLRYAKECEEDAQEQLNDGEGSDEGLLSETVEHDFNKLFEYRKKVLTPYHKLWEEAMMSATLHFIYEELGIHDIYMHTPESGAAYKNFPRGYSQPPASIYRDLPRKFCFNKSHQRPHFLELYSRLNQLETHPYFKKRKNKLKSYIDREYKLSTLPMQRLSL